MAQQMVANGKLVFIYSDVSLSTSGGTTTLKLPRLAEKRYLPVFMVTNGVSPPSPSYTPYQFAQVKDYQGNSYMDISYNSSTQVLTFTWNNSNYTFIGRVGVFVIT